ncbi:MAG: DUF488 domain-containing protein [Clostridiales bacterium]|nr:DUF488 domain-containing protein [Clostridiales bacterium]
MSGQIYTIGYSGFKIDDFVSVLKGFGIAILIDVRSMPYSMYFKSYNEKVLSATLSLSGIKYKNFKIEFGARQENEELYTDGYLDFEKFATSEQFQRGIREVGVVVQNGKNLCLMCAEKDPLSCHRAVLCGKELYDGGFEVLHILSEKEGVALEKHEELEKRLIELYFKNGVEQYDLFVSVQDKLKESYRLHNKKIGYRKKA